MELLFFPEGMGDSRWHESGETLFQGLDHSAIAIADTDRSLRFYVGEMGLNLRYASFNKGIEQQRLDDLDAAEVVIHGVGGEAGCGVEFLRYVQPAPIGPSSVDLQPQDPLYAQILLKDSTLASGQLLVDPDGHRLWLHP
jgi:catechol 2,3-dioxygenase-like lactoylglutathione lyase family enzyme